MVDHLYDTLGEAGLTALVAAFYRGVREDDLLGPMYPKQDLAGAEQRLRDFLIYRLGGPPRYLEERGHPRLRMRHFPFRIGPRERERWLELMERAMAETHTPPEVAEVLRPFFTQVAEAMQNHEG